MGAREEPPPRSRSEGSTPDDVPDVVHDPVVAEARSAGEAAWIAGGETIAGYFAEIARARATSGHSGPVLADLAEEPS